MKNQSKPNAMALKKRMLLNIGIIVLSIIVILSLIAFINLDTSYGRVIASTKSNFDSNIKTAVQTLISSLDQVNQLSVDGVITADEAMEIAKDIVRDTRYSSAPGLVGDGYFWADMADGLCIVHYNAANEGAMRLNAQDKEGTYYIQNFIKLGNSGGGYSDFYFGKPGDENGSYMKRGYTEKFEPYGWYISTGNYYQDTYKIIADVYTARTIAFIVLVGAGILISALGLYILSKNLNGIIKPIKSVVDHINYLSKGDTVSFVTEEITRNDEIGTLQREMIELSDSMALQSSIIEAIADGDLTVSYEPRSANDSVGNSLKKMLESNNRAFAEINSASGTVASVSQQVADGAQSLADGSAEQTSKIDDLSQSLSTILEQAKMNAHSASAALENVSETANLINESTTHVEQMQATMQTITESSSAIANVIKVIDDIAFQTNIMALNAAIEAARAGQYGKGFAVVADEVRNLASKSAKAARETADLISSSFAHIQEGNEVAQQAMESMGVVVSFAEKTQAKIEEINAATKEQEGAIIEINEGLEQISRVVQENNATSEASAAMSEEMSSQAAILADAMSRFKLLS